LFAIVKNLLGCARASDEEGGAEEREDGPRAELNKGFQSRIDVFAGDQLHNFRPGRVEVRARAPWRPSPSHACEQRG
jgi:hypothetical protein